VPTQDGDRVRGHPTVSFEFEGRMLTANDGDTVAAALLRNGVRILSRSSKYHRPRGYRCGMGHCSACSMRVDGLPGVRTCVTRVRPGMRVEREHGLPGAGVDVLRAAELLAPLLSAGFYYRWFRRSPALWGFAERVLAQVAGQGALPSAEAAERFGMARCRRVEADVLVVGGGVAGLSASVAAAEAGSRVLLVEQDDRLGGRLADALPAGPGEPFSGPAGSADSLLAAKLREAVLGAERITALLGVAAVGWYDDGTVAVDRDPDLLLVSPRAVVLATGGYDRGIPFPGWDLPGVMTAAGARRLSRRYGVRPGARAVVLTTDDLGYRLAAELAADGVEIACVADTRAVQHIDAGYRAGTAAPGAARTDTAGPFRTAAHGASLLSSTSGARAHGLRHIKGLSLLHGSAGRRETARFACDLVCVSAGVRPADELACQARSTGSITLSASGTPAPPLWLVGLAAGETVADAAAAQGSRAGAEAAGAAIGRRR
jgi:sarcosine oxidase, subunit alpha